MGSSVQPQADPAQITAGVKALQAQGAPDEVIHAYLTHMGMQEHAPQPSFISRVGKQVGDFATQAITHPIDTLGGMAKSVGKSAYDTFASPVIGEQPQNDLAMIHGTDKPVTAQTPGAITRDRFNNAAIQTVANAALPSIAKGVGGALGGSFLARMAGSGAAGSVAGAAASPGDRAVGAVSGGLIGPLAHGATKAIGGVTGAVGGAALRGLSRAVPESMGGESARLATGAPSATPAGKAMALEGKVLGKAGVDPSAVADAIDQTNPLYAKAYGHGEIKNPATLDLLDQLRDFPAVQRAWKRGQALKAMQHLNDDPTEVTTAGGMTGQQQVDALISQGVPRERALASVAPGSVSGPTVEDLDYLKRGLDAEIETSRGSKKAISRTEAGTLQHHLGSLLDMVDQEVPDYAAARKNFSNAASIRPVQDLLKQKADALGTVPQAVSGVGSSSSPVGHDLGAAALGSHYGQMNLMRKAGGLMGIGDSKVKPAVADALSENLSLKGSDRAALLRRLVADQTDRSAARQRLASFLGMSGAAQPIGTFAADRQQSTTPQAP